MNNTTLEPGVPFPMKPNASGPEVPFPMRIVDEVLCRDCPFPMQQHWPEEVKTKMEDWQKTALEEMTKRFSPHGGEETATYPELIGRTLEVVHPGGGARFINNPNRIVISVDENDHIAHISLGAGIHPNPEER